MDPCSSSRKKKIEQKREYEQQFWFLYYLGTICTVYIGDFWICILFKCYDSTIQQRK